MSSDPLGRIILPVRYYVWVVLITLVVSFGLAFGLHFLFKPETRQDEFLWGASILSFVILNLALFFLTRDSVRRLRQNDQKALEQLDKIILANEENQKVLAVERQQRLLAQSLNQASLTIGETLELNQLLDMICQEGIRIFEASAAYLWLVDREDLVGYSAQGAGSEEFMGVRYPMADPKLMGAAVIRERRPLIVNDAQHSPTVNQKFVQVFNIKSMVGIPLIRDGRPIGALIVLDSRDPGHFKSIDVETANFFAAYVVIAIGNAQHYERSWRQIRHQRALTEIDRAISSSMDREAVLDVVLEQVIKQLNVDAASILLVDSLSQTLVYTGGKGFRTYKILHTRLPLEDEYAGRAAREQNLISALDIRETQPTFERYALLASENFVSYYAAPMVSKGKALGVLEVFHRTKLPVNEEWLDFLKTLAGQTVLAIENAALVMDLRKANLDLNQAYDENISGWASALELRDRETQGHTQRVTFLFEELASAMGVTKEHLVHMRRGAMLHDIGKMAMPDSILFKGDELSDEEQLIMRQHPQLAYDMLRPIQYLREALDIPWCHHENWDGSGYPRGLKGTDIPLASRIFSVVDVYDALTSDRPYHKAIPPKEALLYIRDHAGRQFDPQVVDTFLNLPSSRQSRPPFLPPN